MTPSLLEVNNLKQTANFNLNDSDEVNEGNEEEDEEEEEDKKTNYDKKYIKESEDRSKNDDVDKNQILSEPNCDNNTNNIRKKHIIDNSCGDGAFLKVIVERYIDACKIDNLSVEETAKEIETYIHGIEIDNDLRVSAFVNLQRPV